MTVHFLPSSEKRPRRMTKLGLCEGCEFMTMKTFCLHVLNFKAAPTNKVHVWFSHCISLQEIVANRLMMFHQYKQVIYITPLFKRCMQIFSREKLTVGHSIILHENIKQVMVLKFLSVS